MRTTASRPSSPPSPAASPLARRLAVAAALASLLLLLALAGQLRVSLPAAIPTRPAKKKNNPLRPLAPFQPQRREAKCDDSCPSARDGKCDEGRPPRATPLDNPDDAGGNHPYYLVSCDLGTDCADCGPWAGGASNTSAWDGNNHQGPIAFLREKGFEVRARRAVVPGAGGAPLAFWFAYADPALDVDVSRSAHETGVVESGLTALAVRALERPCGARRRWRRWRRGSDDRLRLLVGGPAAPLHPEQKGGAGLDPSLSFADTPELGATYPAALEDEQDAENDGLLLDVGANFGWFSLLAASLGCRAVAWEPVPRFRAYLEWAVARNRLLESVHVRAAAVTDRATAATATATANATKQQLIEVVAGNRGIWGTAGIGGANLDPSVANAGEYERTLVKGERLDTVAKELVSKGLLRPDAAAAARGAVGPYELPQEAIPIIYPRVDLLKADVEGFEPAVIRSAVAVGAAGPGGGGRGGGGRRPRPPAPPPPQLLHHVRSAAIEYSPGVHERAQRWDRAQDPPRMLLRLMRSMGGGSERVRVAHLPDAFVRAPPSAFGGGNVGSSNAADDDDHNAIAPLPKISASTRRVGLREVTRAALAHDLQDAARFSAAGSGVVAAAAEPAPTCDAMRRSGLPAQGIPEGLHPCGFRSTFGHNTNVFATVDEAVVRPEEWAKEDEEEEAGGGTASAASTLPPRAPLPWFVPEGQEAGMGGRLCSIMTRDVFWPQSSSPPTAAERARILLSHRCRCPRSPPPGDDEGRNATRDASDLLECRAIEDAADACARGGSTGFVAMAEQEVEETLAHDERREAAEMEAQEEDAAV